MNIFKIFISLSYLTLTKSEVLSCAQLKTKFGTECSNACSNSADTMTTACDNQFTLYNIHCSCAVDNPAFGCTTEGASNYDSTATVDDGSCETCDTAFTLTVEAISPVGGSSGLTYRFYVDMTEGESILQVFGTYDYPLKINTPEGAFNSNVPVNWNADSVNPVFFDYFPTIQDDTYATIGIGVMGATDLSRVDTTDADGNFSSYFTTNGATSLYSNNVGWFAGDVGRRGPDANNRVLILQVTTTGDITGTLNYEVDDNINVLPGGFSVDFDGVGTYCRLPIEGEMFYSTWDELS